MRSSFPPQVILQAATEAREHYEKQAREQREAWIAAFAIKVETRWTWSPRLRLLPYRRATCMGVEAATALFDRFMDNPLLISHLPVPRMADKARQMAKRLQYWAAYRACHTVTLEDNELALLAPWLYDGDGEPVKPLVDEPNEERLRALGWS